MQENENRYCYSQMLRRYENKTSMLLDNKAVQFVLMYIVAVGVYFLVGWALSLNVAVYTVTELFAAVGVFAVAIIPAKVLGTALTIYGNKARHITMEIVSIHLEDTGVRVERGIRGEVFVPFTDILSMEFQYADESVHLYSSNRFSDKRVVRVAANKGVVFYIDREHNDLFHELEAKSGIHPKKSWEKCIETDMKYACTMGKELDVYSIPCVVQPMRIPEGLGLAYCGPEFPDKVTYADFGRSGQDDSVGS